MLIKTVSTPKITEKVHTFLSHKLQPGDWVVDATAGNGWDTLFLAHCVLPQGKIWAIDIQEMALINTQQRLLAAGYTDNILLIKESHARLHRLLPKEAHGQIKAILFNLGYLPKGPKGLTTQSRSTLQALEKALTLLRVGGYVSIVSYPGHPEGALEHTALMQWLTTLSSNHYSVESYQPPFQRRPAPQWHLLQKKSLACYRKGLI